MKTAVVMAVYNGEQFLREQLESIACQSRIPDEILIRDDGSADRSVEVIHQFQKDHPGLPVRLVLNEKNRGYKENFRLLIEQTDADWIFLSDQDDRWHPEKVKRMMETVMNHPEVEALASSFLFMDSDSNTYSVLQKKGWSNQNLIPRPIETGKLEPISQEELIFHNYFQGSSMLISRKTAGEFLDRYSDRIPHDWLISLLAAGNGGLFFLNEPLFDYRIHSQNTTGLPQASRFALLRRFQTINTEYNRTVVVEDSNRVLATMREKTPESWNSDREELLRFTEEHLEALRNRDTGKILSQLSSPMAGKFKSAGGRLMDIIFCLSHRKDSGG